MLFGTQAVNSKGHLEIGGCDTIELAEQFGTPLYVMDEAFIRQNCRDYIKAFKSRYENSAIAFAGKAFLSTAMCRILQQEGFCLDVASGGELYTALKAGFPVENLFFHGNFKSDEELRLGLEAGVGRIVVDNVYELERLNEIALEMGKKADILFRLTPGVDPHTHRLISTGQEDSKFGINIKNGDALAAVKRAIECPGVALRGIHCHVGSQLLDLDAHVGAIPIMVGFARQVRDETGVVIEEINTGGGLGISYLSDQNPPTIDQFAEALVGAFVTAMDEAGLPNRPRLIQEPGRSIVGPAGITLYSVGTVKRVSIAEDPGYRTYVIVDGGLSDNPRPLLYDAVYEALIANKANEPASQIVTVSGKHCETDMLIENTPVAPVETGDVLAVLCTGAYNFSMASNYNRMRRPAVVLVKDGKAHEIVQRECLDDLIKRDVIPDHLA